MYIEFTSTAISELLITQDNTQTQLLIARKIHLAQMLREIDKLL